jgi:hypothetical protein
MSLNCVWGLNHKYPQRLQLIGKRKIEESVIVLSHHAIRDSSAANWNRESFKDNKDAT